MKPVPPSTRIFSALVFDATVIRDDKAKPAPTAPKPVKRPRLLILFIIAPLPVILFVKRLYCTNLV